MYLALSERTVPIDVNQYTKYIHVLYLLYMILIMFSILSVLIKNIYILVHLKKCSLLFTLTQFMFTLFTFHEKKVIATLKRHTNFLATKVKENNLLY